MGRWAAVPVTLAILVAVALGIRAFVSGDDGAADAKRDRDEDRESDRHGCPPADPSVRRLHRFRVATRPSDATR
jgi:hypothetical protein